MRRFEHAGLGKFWTIAWGGSVINVTFGKLGTTGQRHDRTFESESAAAEKAREMIAKQLADGYVEVGAAASPTPAVAAPSRWYRRYETTTGYEDQRRYIDLVLDERWVRQRHGELVPDPEDEPARFQGSELATVAEARDVAERIAANAIERGFVLEFERAELPAEPIEDDADDDDGDDAVRALKKRVVAPRQLELEAHCLAQRDAPDVWAVYADWLMTKDDPRGELAALRAQGKVREADALYARHKRALLGSFELAKAAHILDYRHGFPCAAALRRDDDGPPLHELVAAFLALPFAAFIDGLQFGLASYQSDNDWGPTIAAVTKSAQAIEFRSLRFDAYTRDDCEVSWTPFGDFSTAWSQLPRLEELRIKSGAGGVLGALDLPELRTFARVSGGLAATELAAICNARWPKLEHLEIWFGSSGHGAEGTVSRIERILDGDGLPALRHLGLVNCEFGDELVPALASSKILRRIETLDLGKGVLAHSGAAALIECARAFEHLEAIDLDSNQLLDGELDRIARVLPQVKRGRQRANDRDEGSDPDEDYRYVALGE